MKHFAIVFSLLMAVSSSYADGILDAAIAKARTAVAKGTVEVPAENIQKISKEEREKRKEEAFRDRSGKNLLASTAKATLFKVSPGQHHGIKLTQDSCIVEGELEADKPIPQLYELRVEADNCVIRNVFCNRLKLANGAKATVVDSIIGTVVFDDPGEGDEAKKTKCELVAGNCTVFSIYLEGPKSYVVHYVNNSGGRHDEPVSVNNNKCQFKFKNCSLLLKRPIETSGMVGLTFSKCVFSQRENPYKIDRGMDGKCSLEFEDCAIYQKDAAGKAFSDSTGSAFIQDVRQESGKAIMRGKLTFLTESPFIYESGKGEKFLNDLWNMTLEESSSANQLGLGALIGNSGMPAATKAAAKAQPKPKGQLKSDGPEDDKLDKELEEASRKLKDASGK